MGPRLRYCEGSGVMIYKALYDYSIQQSLTPLPNRESRKVAAYICLETSIDEDGNETNDWDEGEPTLSLTSRDGGKLDEVNCPSIGNFSQGNAANPLCEKVEIILGRKVKNADSGMSELEDSKKHAAWCGITMNMVEVFPEFRPIIQFQEKVDGDADFRKKIYDDLNSSKVKEKDYISFRINGENVLKMEALWGSWFDNYMAEMGDKKNASRNKDNNSTSWTAISCITGKSVIPMISQIPKVRASQTGTGVPVISFDKASFSSYIWDSKDARNCIMAEKEAMMIRDAEEFLMNSPHNHDDKSNLLYFYDEEVSVGLDVLGAFMDNALEDREQAEVEAEAEQASSNMTQEELFFAAQKKLQENKKENKKKKNKAEEERRARQKEKEEKYRDARKAILNGTYPSNLKNVHYHLIHYMLPEQGRQALDQERTGTYEELVTNISRWWKESSVQDFKYVNEASDGSGSSSGKAGKGEWIPVERHLGNIWNVWRALLEHPPAEKKKQNWLARFKIEYGRGKDELLFAIYEGRQIPRIYLVKAVNRCMKAMITGNSIPLIPIQVIKVYLNRESAYEGEFMSTSLNESNQSKGYLCGRLLAVLNRMQLEYYDYKRPNRTLAESSCKQASEHPAKAFGPLLKNYIVYQSKLAEKNRDWEFSLLVGEIVDKIGEDLPNDLTLEEQAAFAFGYWSQEKYFIEQMQKRKKKNRASASSGANAAPSPESMPSDQEEGLSQ